MLIFVATADGMLDVGGRKVRCALGPAGVTPAAAKREGDGASPAGIWPIREVIYLGINTRYTVDLDGGGELVVVEQNLETTSMDVVAARGRKVRLTFARSHVRQIGG